AAADAKKAAEAKAAAEAKKPARSSSAPAKVKKPADVELAESSTRRLKLKEKYSKALQEVDQKTKEAEAKDRDLINQASGLDTKIKKVDEEYRKALGSNKDAKLKELTQLRDQRVAVGKQRKAVEASLVDQKRATNTAKKSADVSWEMSVRYNFLRPIQHMGLVARGILILLALHAVSAYRFDTQPRRDEVRTSEALRGATRCQYSSFPSAVPSGRPPFKSLIALCPNNELKSKCAHEARSSAFRVVVIPQDSLGIADCENFCSANYAMESDGGRCLGYVVRNPFNDKVEKGKAQCWLIRGNAEVSGSHPDEVKLDRDSYKASNPKLTFVKEYCGCEARYVHFVRPEFHTELAVKRHRLALLRKEDPDSTELPELSKRVGVLEKEEQRYERLEKFEGIYDWLPLRPPHKISKGLERILPNWLVKSMKPSLITNQGIHYSNYWHAPVRISKIFKKSDLSSFLYRCLDKESDTENWYLATQGDPITWASRTFEDLANRSEEDVKEKLSDETFIQKIFFRMECVGTKVGDDNMVQIQADGEPLGAWLDEHFVSSYEFPKERLKRTISLKTPRGCYPTNKKAEEASEEKVIEEVGACPVAALTKPANASMIGLRTFWDDDAGAMEKIGAAQWFIDTMNKHQRISGTVFTVAKWVSRGVNALWGGKEEKKEEKVAKWSDFSSQEMKAMLERTTVLLKGISRLFLVMEAASNTEDMQIKLVCAKEVLDSIFEVGGLLPKVSQNLAMRPDLVKDDFVRNKLKETQNANPSRSEEETIAYLEKQAPEISIPGFEQTVPMLRLLKYEKALSAGSVGQVDLFRLRDGPEGVDVVTRREFKSMLPEGHGDVVIVKTVFEETEAEYKNDWNLLEQFFTNFKDSLDASLSVMWKILSPMKKSIFDEFDLRDEAKFTMRGKEMLAEFTQNINKGLYQPTLRPHSLTLTTPNAVATSSKYILIQSLASGTPLKNFLENSNGQMEPLVEWRQGVYSAILMVYGHMVVKHGFFQSDPHNGNWFWEPESRTVTLIDWGGVGQLDDDTHCKLANLYSHMGSLVKDWNDCESVELSGADEIAGVYHRSGFSIYEAKENQTALLLGYTYGVAYYNEELGYRLFFSGGTTWKVVLEYPGRQELYSTLAELETTTGDIERLANQPAQRWKIFKSGKHKKNVAVTVTVSDPAKRCGLPSRKQAYSQAARNMGLGLNFNCKAEDTVLLPEAPLAQVEDLTKWKDNGKRQLGCIRKTEEENFVWWGVHNPFKLRVQTDEHGRRFVKLASTKWDLDADPAQTDFYASWVHDVFMEKSKAEIVKLTHPKRSMLLSAAQNHLALAASLYDSDLLLAAVLGVAAKTSVGLVSPEVPNEYVLLARCIVVFHGMLGDVVKENFMRLIVSGQQDYLQWLLRPSGDRFFRSWKKPALEYLASHRETCSSEGWDLRQREGR
ncbi:unnamed protein product, partial [Symbiodinium necroappetens]